MCVPKSKLLLEKLFEIAKAGFSPSSLTNYMRNPMQFYFQRVLKIGDTDEVEENIAVNTLGTIIHDTLEALYKPVCHKILTIDDLAHMNALLSQEVLTQFKTIYKEGDITSGKNLLAFEVAKRHIQNFLKLEEEAILKGDIVEVLHLELAEDRKFFHENLPFEVLLKGSIDRVERRNGTLRVVDYKTGKVVPNDLKLSQWEGLTLDIKNDKIIQLFSYAYILAKVYPNEPIEAGIVSFKNLKSGFMPFQMVQGRTVLLDTITNDTLKFFENELSLLIAEILNPEFDFKEQLV
jgi:ATP-dependent helicase/DNAse subunit B